MAHKRLVTRTPQSWLGTIVEAAFGTCGRSIIIDGAWYRFKHGRGLIASSAEVAVTRPELCVVDAGPCDDGDRLRALVGTRWSILHNCVTVFAPFWRSDMSGVTPGDRSSIARSVVLSLIALFAFIVLVILGVVWADDRIDAKFEKASDRHEEMYRSVVTHLGQIKSALGTVKNPRPPDRDWETYPK